LEELDIEGAQIQSAVQSAFDVVILRLHKKGETKQVLISLSPGACRLHETFRPFPKSEKPLRFAQFLNSKIVNGRIMSAAQIGGDRIVRIEVKHLDAVFRLYVRLWSNAANFIVTDGEGAVLDAMRRLPKRGEVTGGRYSPETSSSADQKTAREYEVREFPGEGTFNQKIDEHYAAQGGPLSLEALRERARRECEGSMARISAALEKLREKEASFADAGRLKTYGDLVLSNIAQIKPGDQWLEAEEDGKMMRIELDPRASPQSQAAKYYEQYRKAKKGLVEIQEEIAAGERELDEVKNRLNRLLAETNPLVLAKLIKASGLQGRSVQARSLKKKKKTPGLQFKRGDWLIIVGRDAAENDELLRRHVKGNDLWLHARDYHGSYVFIRQRAGKTVPLDILLDAGNLAIFYSKGRNSGEGDLFYTSVKHLRRAKDGPKGLVIPTQEKNLHVKTDEKRLRALETSRIF
ncbi:MAG: NFACT family protein, partial [Treponema sp.]|nr:NFACT family protein [Treponema sp.]